jgi:hypothetical protein
MLLKKPRTALIYEKDDINPLLVELKDSPL